MSKKKGIICIGVSYSAPFYYLAGYSFASSSECLFLSKSVCLQPQKYPLAIWVTSLAYPLFDIYELNADELLILKCSNHKKQIQYLGLKNGVHFWQACAIPSTVFEEQITILGQAKKAIHVLELDLLALWEYAFIKTIAPFKTRLVLWQKEPYLIAMLGREATFWKVWYCSIHRHILADIEDISFPKPELISCFSALDIESNIPFEIIGLETESEYTLAIALAHRGIRHAL